MTEKLGNYIKCDCCSKCDWVKLVPHPRSIAMAAMISLIDCCPKCGSDLKKVVGRWRYRETKKLFGSKTEFLEFVRKE